MGEKTSASPALALPTLITWSTPPATPAGYGGLHHQLILSTGYTHIGRGAGMKKASCDAYPATAASAYVT